MEDYWGNQWPRVEQELAESGINLEAIEDLPPPWEVVASETQALMTFSDAHVDVLRSRYLWPDNATAEELAKRFDLGQKVVDDIALAEIDAIAQTHRSAASDGIDHYRSLANAAISECWASGRYRRAPIFLPSLEKNEEHRPLLFSSSCTHRGWCIGFAIYADDFPDLGATLEELERIRRERDDEIRSYLSKLP